MRVILLIVLLALTGCSGNVGPGISSDAPASDTKGWKVRVFSGSEMAREWTAKDGVEYGYRTSRCRFQDAKTGEWVIVQGSCVITKD